jgi:hypothetical protein
MSFETEKQPLRPAQCGEGETKEEAKRQSKGMREQTTTVHSQNYAYVKTLEHMMKKTGTC